MAWKGPWVQADTIVVPGHGHLQGEVLTVGSFPIAIAPARAKQALAEAGAHFAVVRARHQPRTARQPPDRLEQIEKIDLARTTLCEWVAAAATPLTPIGEQLQREITATDYVHTYSTSITALADDRGGSYKQRL